jgi:hypothetical protein
MDYPSFVLGDMVVWDEAVYDAGLLAGVVNRYGKGPFKVVGLRLYREGEKRIRAPFAVTIWISEGDWQELAGEWFKKAEPKPRERISCKIERHEVALDPPITVLHVELSNKGGCWPETFTDETHVKTFLRGVSAGASLSGGAIFFPPELPSSTASIFVPREVSEEGSDES